MEATVGANRQRRALRANPVLALVGEPAAVLSRATGVAYEPVPQHLERQVALEQLDRLVREVGERVLDPLEADDVARGPQAPTITSVVTNARRASS